MSEINLDQVFKVVIIEFERGWGQRVDEVKYFDNETEAKNYCDKFNSRNTLGRAPDWYMIADYCGRIS